MKTFVVRVFVSADQAEVPLAGIVEHIGTGRKLTFHGGDDLVDAVLHELTIDTPDGAASEELESPSRRLGEEGP